MKNLNPSSGIQTTIQTNSNSKKLIKLKRKKEYSLMIILADIIIDAFLLSKRETTNKLNSEKVLVKGGDGHG